MSDVVQRQLDAYNRRDLAAFLECYHSDVSVRGLLSSDRDSDGIAQFKAIYSELFSRSPALKCTLKNRIVLEPVVIDEEFVTGLARYPKGLHTVAIYSFLDGKINKVWFPS